MIKTLLAGIILGALGAAGLTWYVPAVDLHRERSLISVQPNGGNIEVFHINLPRDRILVGLAGDANSIPAGLAWPGRELLGDMLAEMFKVRDGNNAVIGVASRLASASDRTGAFIEWTVHFPARGTIYAQMDITPTADGVRNGRLLAGTRDFATLTGSMRERLVAEADEEADISSRIELEAALIAPLGVEE